MKQIISSDVRAKVPLTLPLQASDELDVGFPITIKTDGEDVNGEPPAEDETSKSVVDFEGAVTVNVNCPPKLDDVNDIEPEPEYVPVVYVDVKSEESPVVADISFDTIIVHVIRSVTRIIVEAAPHDSVDAAVGMP